MEKLYEKLTNRLYNLYDKYALRSLSDKLLSEDLQIPLAAIPRYTNVADSIALYRGNNGKYAIQPATKKEYEFNRKVSDKLLKDYSDPSFEIYAKDDKGHYNQIDKAAYLKTVRPIYNYISAVTLKDNKKILNTLDGENYIQEIARQYGVNPNLIAHRLLKEGSVNQLIHKYNYLTPYAAQKNGIDYYNTNFDLFYDLGLDTFLERYGKDNSIIKNDRLRQQLDTAQVIDVVNEAGHPGKTTKVSGRDAIELYAAFFNDMQRRHPNATLEELNAMYNLGENHKDLKKKDWIYRTYQVPEYYDKYRNGGHLHRSLYSMGQLSDY